MCGIVGYIGSKNATPFLISALCNLEYRGYDSSGIAINSNNQITILKEKGKLDNLKKLLLEHPEVHGTSGIGHTRWATHGEPSQKNSHPHLSWKNNFAIVHNGIIENYLDLKSFLESKSVPFVSDTDSEIIAHLMEYHYNGDLLETLYKTMDMLNGSYSLAILSKNYPDKIIVAKKSSPLIIGLGDGENFIASDISALASKTRKIIRLDDNEVAILDKDSVNVFSHKTKKNISKQPIEIDWKIASVDKNNYKHFMLKEIHEQPDVLSRTIKSRIENGSISLHGLEITNEEIKNITKIHIIACGSAYHVGYAAKYILEKIAKKPVEVDFASEFRYKELLVNKSTLLIAISQSGETADTLAALRKGKEFGAKTLAIVNVTASSIANEADSVIYTDAGIEIAVATTKAYSSQLAIIYLLALHIGQVNNTLSVSEYSAYLNELLLLPNKVKEILAQDNRIKALSDMYYQHENIFFIGRNLDYATALEGSLKLKEVSYIHSEAYAAGELKHGTISLIEKGTIVVAICTIQSLFDKMISNIKELKARGAFVISILSSNEINNNIKVLSDEYVIIPETLEIFSPSLSIIPLQLLAYHISVKRGCDVDKPKNLAKSVTVE